MPLRVEDDVFLLVEVCMLVLRESKGAGAEEAGNEDCGMHFDVVNGTCQVGEVGIVRSYMFRFSENGRRKG